MASKKILIAEDDSKSTELLEDILKEAGYKVDSAANGKIALNKLKNNNYDALLTDWMMPEMDGIELIRNVREKIKPVPLIMVITAIAQESAKEYAINSGADDFIGKPYDIDEILKRIKSLFARRQHKVPVKIEVPEIVCKKLPEFTAVCIAVSSGGPQTMREFLKILNVTNKAAYLVVQHSPKWALSQMAKSWDKISSLKVVLAENGMKVDPGKLYLAPGDKHMIITGSSIKILLKDGPLENFVKPAADPLFRSIAKVFGSKSVAIILTGMGCDGTNGAKHIQAVHGKIIAQNPETALVKYMPASIQKHISESLVLNIQEMPHALNKIIDENINDSPAKSNLLKF